MPELLDSPDVLYGFERRQRLRAEMSAMTEQLVAEFAETHSGDAVRRCVSRARAHLLETGVRHGLVHATEAAARLTLRQTCQRAAANTWGR